MRKVLYVYKNEYISPAIPFYSSTSFRCLCDKRYINWSLILGLKCSRGVSLRKYKIIEKSGSVIIVNRVEIGLCSGADSLYVAILHADN